MWEDSVIIGNPPATRSSFETIQLVSEVRGQRKIYQGANVYWVANCYLGIGLLIDKNSSVGICLNRMIESEETFDTINEFLIDAWIRNVSPSKLKQAIDNEMRRSFQNGAQSKINEIKDALGLRN